MIENKLQADKLKHLLKPFLELADKEQIFNQLSKTIGISIAKQEDILCQTRILVTYKGYKVDLRDLRQIGDSGFAVEIQFKAKRRWWHGILRDQNREIVEDIKKICVAVIQGLVFDHYTTTVPDTALYDDNSSDTLDFYHDSRAFNPNWDYGSDISPLLIAPDYHHGNNFVEFHFNPAGYRRQNDKTVLRSDWLDGVSAVSEGINRDARKILGMEGLRKEYYDNGNLKLEENYKNGKAEGLSKLYYESGELKIELNYKNDRVEGLSKKYYVSGKLENEENYKNGKLEGLAKSYYENGQLQTEYNYKDGKR